MPQNCAFLNCSHSTRYERISLFRIPFPKTSDSEYTSLLKLEAREAWKTAIPRAREETSELKTRFVKHNIFLCEHHFEQDCIESFLFTDAKANEKTRKRPQTGSVPTLNLPVKLWIFCPGHRRHSKEGLLFVMRRHRQLHLRLLVQRKFHLSTI